MGRPTWLSDLNKTQTDKSASPKQKKTNNNNQTPALLYGRTEIRYTASGNQQRQQEKKKAVGISKCIISIIRNKNWWQKNKPAVIMCKKGGLYIWIYSPELTFHLRANFSEMGPLQTTVPRVPCNARSWLGRSRNQGLRTWRTIPGWGSW